MESGQGVRMESWSESEDGEWSESEDGEWSESEDGESGQHLGFCSRGGKIAVYAYQGGASATCCTIQYIYSKISRGGKHPARGGECPPPPPPPK